MPLGLAIRQLENKWEKERNRLDERRWFTVKNYKSSRQINLAVLDV